jgi:hypothetical protein
MRVSTAVLIVAFIALFWVQQTFEPKPEAPAPAVVPPGFVPDPNYTWVPRTNVRRPKESEYPTTTTTTTSPTETSPTETTPPTETTGPTSPTDTTDTTPPTSVTDPDGSGPLLPQIAPATPSPTPATSPAPGSGPAATAPALPR